MMQVLKVEAFLLHKNIGFRFPAMKKLSILLLGPGSV